MMVKIENCNFLLILKMLHFLKKVLTKSKIFFLLFTCWFWVHCAHRRSKANNRRFCLGGKIACRTGNFWSECGNVYVHSCGTFVIYKYPPHNIDPACLLTICLLHRLNRSMWLAIFPQKAMTTVCLGLFTYKSFFYDYAITKVTFSESAF